MVTCGFAVLGALGKLTVYKEHRRPEVRKKSGGPRGSALFRLEATGKLEPDTLLTTDISMV